MCIAIVILNNCNSFFPDLYDLLNLFHFSRRHGKPLWYYKIVTGAPTRTIPSDGTGERPWLYFEVYEVSADFERTIDLAIIRVTPSFNLGSDAVAVVQLAMNLYEGGEECYVGGWGDQNVNDFNPEFLSYKLYFLSLRLAMMTTSASIR